jgi:pimeloyl-ACP methyl ester carboxylesterase
MNPRTRWHSVPALALTIIVFHASPVLSQVDGIRPPLGTLVDVGQRRMHLHCTGSGSPVVVLEAGASSFALDWALVQPALARTTRVCSYDRAGLGWSDPTTRGDTPENIVRDLRALLQVARERGPFILVGASRGGIYTRMFELLHPSDVAGMVFVDPSHEDRLFVDVDGKTVPIWARSIDDIRAALPPDSTWDAVRAIISRPTRDPQTGAPFDRLPRDLYDARVQFDKRLIRSGAPTTYEQYVEQEIGRQSAYIVLHERATSTGRAFGDRPVIVLTRGSANEGLITVHAALAAESTNSRHTVVAGAGHEIHLFAPDAVIQAVQDVVEASRRGSRLPAR